MPADLLLEPLLFLLHPVIAHRLVPRGVGLDLGPVQGDGPHPRQPGQGTQLEHFEEEILQPSQVGLAKVADRAKVRNVLADDDPAGDVHLTAAHDFPRGTCAGGVTIQKQRDHHPGVERRLPPQLALIMSADWGQVERGNGINHEVDQIALRQPVARRGRKHIDLVWGPLAVGFAHAAISTNQVTGNYWPPDYSNPAIERQYSDRLLVLLSRYRLRLFLNGANRLCLR